MQDAPRAATHEQIAEIRALGGNPDGLTYAKAKQRLMYLRDDRDAVINEAGEYLNEPALRARWGYKKLTKAQLAAMVIHLSSKDRYWEDRPHDELAKEVLVACPEAAKASTKPKQQAAQTPTAQADAPTSSGCLVLVACPLLVMAVAAVSYLI